MIWSAQRWGWCRGRVSRKLKEARWECPAVGGEGGVSYCLYIVIDRKVCILAEIRAVKRTKSPCSKQARMPVSAIMNVIVSWCKIILSRVGILCCATTNYPAVSLSPGGVKPVRGYQSLKDKR